MTLSSLIVFEPIPATQQDTFQLLLQDREWVQAQFVTIMNTAGFGDRPIVGTIACPPPRGDVRWNPNTTRPVAATGRVSLGEAVSRVRSPPTR